MKNYNPEIDCLRGIAVIGVILYHAQIIIFETLITKNFFITLDIFFIVSGFVTTKLFFKENFSFNIFIERRIRRLIPPLLSLILITTLFSYFLLLPQHFYNLGQSIVANILLISNFLFFYQTNYWDYASFTKPLLHTWSLSLEFQFYIFISLAFWFFRKNIIKVIILLFLTSLIILLFPKEFNFVYNLREFALNNYFLIFARLWEFLAGSLVALFLNNEKYSKNFIFKSYLSNVGLILILLSIFLIKTPNDYPNFLTIVPVLGTSLILLANNTQSRHFILSNSFLIHFGKMSYSLYLWHFPILIFFFYKYNFELNALNKIFALVITYLVSFGSYKFVEIPFFKNNILTRRNFAISLVISSITIFLLGLLIINKVIKSKSHSKYENIKINFSHYNLADTKGPIAERIILVDQFTNSEKTKILICGDSQGADLTMVLQSNKKINEKYEIEFVGFLECINEETLLVKSADYTLSSIQILGKNNLTYNNIKKLHYIVTVKSNKKFIIVGASPEFQTDADLLLNYLAITNMKKEDIMKNIININKFFFKNKKRYINDINKKLFKISKELNVGFLDKFDLICKEKDKICFGVDLSGNKNFIDYTHLSLNGHKFFGNKIANTNWLKLN